MKKNWIFYTLSGAMLFGTLPSCSDNDDANSGNGSEVIDPSLEEQYYAGGKLGTAFIKTSAAFEQPTPAVNESGMFELFNRGEKMFEKPFTSNTNGGEREGLGPLYVRTSCIHCHPGYGHGKSQPDGRFNTNEIGNGYLLVVYNPTNNAYVSWLAGMPQTHAVAPFKDPLDETQITIQWQNYKDEWNNQFPDGETYDLRYPEVSIPQEAVYVINQGYTDATTSNYEVRLESTLGIYGSALLDAIPQDSILAQYDKEYKAAQSGYLTNGLNPSFYKDGEYVGWYSNSKQGDGTKYVRRFTYAASRGPLQDGAGANAIWNITNVTRSDRQYNYLDLNGTIYATCASKDPEVQKEFGSYIAKVADATKHPEWFTDNVEENIYNYLTSKQLDVEMTDDDYMAFMVWHRGLAVPAARNIEDTKIQQGRQLFNEIGCAQCHRPSWTTGEDAVSDPNNFKISDEKSSYYGRTLTSLMPRYPNQKIWPYTDMVQHKLFMKNDIRTGWCRTTALWGRGLHQTCTGATYADRLHDCRARNVIEAIMWHATNEGGTSDAYNSIKKFRELNKDEREAIVEFINAI